jgi:hypothetical protein
MASIWREKKSAGDSSIKTSALEKVGDTQKAARGRVFPDKLIHPGTSYSTNQYDYMSVCAI